MTEKKPLVTYSWQDTMNAGIIEFICICGHNLGKTWIVVSDGCEVECPRCKRKYEFTHVGFICEEIDG